MQKEDHRLLHFHRRGSPKVLVVVEWQHTFTSGVPPRGAGLGVHPNNRRRLQAFTAIIISLWRKIIFPRGARCQWQANNVMPNYDYEIRLSWVVAFLDRGHNGRRMSPGQARSRSREDWHLCSNAGNYFLNFCAIVWCQLREMALEALADAHLVITTGVMQ